MLGIGDWQTQLDYSIKSCRILADYAKANDLVLLVENHGGLLSNANRLLALIKQANHPTLRVMLDYDNFNGQKLKFGKPIKYMIVTKVQKNSCLMLIV